MAVIDQLALQRDLIADAQLAQTLGQCGIIGDDVGVGDGLKILRLGRIRVSGLKPTRPLPAFKRHFFVSACARIAAPHHAHVHHIEKFVPILMLGKPRIGIELAHNQP